MGGQQADPRGRARAAVAWGAGERHHVTDRGHRAWWIPGPGPGRSIASRIPYRGQVMSELAIGELAEQTGLAAGTIRMWESRYGFPNPARNPSGYRIYTADDVETLRRVLRLRETG